jgi:endonuclease I
MVVASMRPALAIFAFAVAIAAQAPPTYYNTVDTSSATALRSTLHAVIDDHTRFPYTASSTDTWNVLEVADQDPSNSSRILDVYQNTSFAKVGGGNNNYNREHTWPNSYGFPDDGSDNYPYTDCHHLFLCDIGHNSARANFPFDNGNASWNQYTTVANGGQGGGSGAFPGNSNWQSNSPGGWQVWHDRKGDIARALFYMDIRYEGGTHSQTGVTEPDLRLTDNTTLIAQSATGNNELIAYMGKLSVLLQWHQQDPVDAKEMARNNAVFSFQGNRNPFIDNPAWVDCIYNGSCTTGNGSRAPEVWINELHYDNVGVDVGEFVELAGRAGENVDGWLLIAYDGATGNAYSRVNLRGTFANQQNHFGVLSFAFPDLQNGNDGIALVTGSGAVMQFLSYEGDFQASNGAAAGMTSTNIGVSETSSTPIGHSLRLSGNGHAYSDFAWQPAFASSPGTINTTQQFQ